MAARAGRARRASRRLRLLARRVGRRDRGAAGAADCDRRPRGNCRRARDAGRARTPQPDGSTPIVDRGVGLPGRRRLRARRLLARRRTPLRRGPPLRQPRQLPAGAEPARALVRAARTRALHALAGPDRYLRPGPLPHGRHGLGPRRSGVRRARRTSRSPGARSCSSSACAACTAGAGAGASRRSLSPAHYRR